MLNNALQDFWDTMREVIFYPKFMVIFMPSLVFISLFFIPEDYAGWTKSAETMLGTYQNKWLLDITYISILIQVSYVYMNAFFKKDFHENKYKLVKFMKPKENITDEQIANENPKGFRIIFYLLFVAYLVFVNIDLAPLNGSSRWSPEFNRFVFINFFIYFCLPYFLFGYLSLYSFLTKEDLVKGRKVFPRR